MMRGTARLTTVAALSIATLVAGGNISQAADQSSRRGEVYCGPGVAPIAGFEPARETAIPKPKYPKEAENEWSEGWVLLNFTVPADGSLRDPTVVDALGPKGFVNATTKALKFWQFKPATRNGVPVDQYGKEFTVEYRMQGVGAGEAVHREFVRRYNEARALTGAKKYAEAIAMLEQAFKLRVNLYEAAMGSLGFAIAHAQLNEGYQALLHVRRATINGGEYLEKTVRTPAFALRVQLETRDGNYKAAICANKEMLEADPKGDTDAAKTVEQINAGLSNPAPLAIPAILSRNPAVDEPARWWHPMLRSKFHLDQIQGEVKSFRLVCVGTVFEAEVDPEMEWNVPASAGECTLRVEGAPGATFRLIEEW